MRLSNGVIHEIYQGVVDRYNLKPGQISKGGYVLISIDELEPPPALKLYPMEVK